MTHQAKAPSVVSTPGSAGSHGFFALLALTLLAFAGIGAPPALAASPLVSTEPATVGVTTASLPGKVNPSGESGSGPTNWRIEYTPAGEGLWSQIGSGTIEGSEAEEANAISLSAPFGSFGEAQAGASYEFRVIAENESGSATSAPRSFTMHEATAPLLATEAASALGYSSATLHGAVDPEGGNVNPIGGPPPIHWSLQYREAGVFGSGEGWVTAGGGEISGAEAEESNPIAVQAELPPGTLQAAKSYEVRLFAVYLDFARSAESPEPFETLETEAASAPTVTIEDASSITATTAHLSGHVELANSDPAFDTTLCEFDYVADAKFNQSAWAEAQHTGCQPPTVQGAGSTALSADPTDLLPGTTYHLRLRAENQGGSGEATANTFTTESVAPVVDHTFVSAVGQTEATLHAEIDPGGAETTYRFSYLTEQQFHKAGESFAGATETPLEDLGAQDNEDHAVSVAISGLQPDTAYRYRVVATNSAGSGEGEVFVKEGTPTPNYRGFHTLANASEEPGACPNDTVRAEQHSTFLPDCRAYEQVTPVGKNGADVLPVADHTRAASDGNAVQFSSLTGFGDTHGTSIATDYLALRDPGLGWQTHGITPPQAPSSLQEVGYGLQPLYEGEFSADLSQGVFLASSPLTDAPNVAGVANLYLRRDLLAPGVGTYHLLSDATTPQTSDPFANPIVPIIISTSTDFSHILFVSKRNLTADAAAANLDPEQWKIYEWTDGAPPTTRLVDQVPTAPATECGGGAAACTAAASPRLGRDVLSRDGSRAIFVISSSSLNDSGTIYLRDDQGTPTATDDTTIQINVSEKSSPDAAQPAFLQAASSGVDAEGNRVPLRVFFTSSEQLTETPGSGLYVWNQEADGEGNHLSLIANGVTGDSSEGVIGASEDGSYLYFMTGAQLVPGGPTGSPGGPAPGRRIFVWHDGILREVGAIGGDDPRRILQQSLDSARISPDGTHLAFLTQGTDELLSLYGKAEYDHGDSCPQSTFSGCDELYVYDAAANEDNDPVTGDGMLQCASCNPTGQPATADATRLEGLLGEGAANGGLHINHILAGNGHVFFSTPERLLEEDTDGAPDVYEYDTTTERVHLISSGTDGSGAYFLDASADGHDVFFATRAQLLPGDNDRSRDLYDARIGGGFPEPPRPAACDPLGAGCQGPAAAQPPPPAQGTHLSGPGNPHQRRCAPGKVRRHARCKKKKSRKHAHTHRANTNRGGSK